MGIPSPISKKNALAAESPTPVWGKIALAKLSHPKVWIGPALVAATISFDFRTSNPTKRPPSAVQTTIAQAFRRLAFTELILVLGERTHSLAAKSPAAAARNPDGTL